MLLLDQAEWHVAKALNEPNAVTLVPLPPRWSELNPAERVWLQLRKRDLSHRLLDDYHVVEQATFEAWRRLIEQDRRMTSLTYHPWIEDCTTN